MRPWWRPSARPPEPQVPYEVVCPCGTTARGLRQARHQVVVCAGCGRRVFVLPFDPLLAAGPAERPRPHISVRRTRNPWLWPVLAAALTLLLTAAGLALLLLSLLGPTVPHARPRTLADHVQAGQRALAQGKFLLAADELNAAWDLHRQHRDSLSLSERRQLTQLHRQAELLADLLSESLEEILRHAAGLLPDDEEWQREFAKRYRGKAVVFDAEVRPDPARKFQLGYTVFLDDRPARLELGDVQLLQLLPLHQPQRLLFGLRLARVGLEAGGVWVIRFEPDSGVLLTDPGAAAACCLQPAEDFDEVIRRQQTWLADLP